MKLFFLLFLCISLPLQAANTVVTVNTVLGSFDIEMLHDDAPLTVENFLGYVERGDYDGTFIHRSIPGFIIQAGGYAFNETSGQAPHIVIAQPVVNEFKVSNTRGTVAMAKSDGDPDSATSEWFVNLSDSNAANLDNQNGGFTVFGRVLGNGMVIVNAIAALPRNNFNGPFTDTPTINFIGTVTKDIFVTINSVTVEAAVDTDNDGMTDDVDTDDDNDTVLDVDDAFPLDATETTDTDNDGIGNNADVDDDGDGLTDEFELSVGLDPLNPNDVTGSPREILWRHSVSGLNVLWSMETQHRVERNSINRVADANWRVAGMADFTSDGFDEILFRHQGTGSNRLWTIEDGKRTSSLAFQGVSTDWFIIGMGDFDADGDADMMWRNELTGSNRYWEMDGATRLSSLPMRGVSLDWSVAGSGDFDGDSRDDLLWRHKNGTNAIWLMQSEVRVVRGQIPSVSSPWEVAGVGDFDADGQEDIFWHNPETGANSIWLINGAERKSRGTIPAIAIGWAPFGVHDMNGDGMADILWRHTNGSNRLWLMNGTTRISSLPVRNVADRDWIPVAVGNVE